MNSDAYAVKRDLESDDEEIETLDYETMENEEGLFLFFYFISKI